MSLGVSKMCSFVTTQNVDINVNCATTGGQQRLNALYFELTNFLYSFFMLLLLFSLLDVGPAVQAAFCTDLHCPLADHLGLSLSCLCSAVRCAPYPQFTYNHLMSTSK